MPENLLKNARYGRDNLEYKLNLLFHIYDIRIDAVNVLFRLLRTSYMIRAMLKDAQLPIEFWDEAAIAHAYI
jgi:hypothetical protein